MELDFKDGVFVFECEFEERHIPKEARFWWNPRLKRWETTSARCAGRLLQYATQAARARVVDKLLPKYHFRDSSMDRPGKTGRFMKVKHK